MNKKQNKKQGSVSGLMKNGRSSLTRAGRTGRGQRIPPVMILAGVLALAGAAWLYWPAGDSTPTGVGEQQTVVTNLPENTALYDEAGPSSGEVDINQQISSLTPEKAEDGQNTLTSSKETDLGSQKEEEPAPAAKTVSEPKTTVEKSVTKKPVTRKPPPPAPRVKPSISGSYAVQTGSFGNADNADKEAARLKALEWKTSVRAGNNSSGQMVFRVWITFFKSRQEAQLFINQNGKHIPGAIPVHR
ncbi:MAG: SPOR domain-containing protein [Gemmatimonadales bacterium]|nr:SPOR domain-containing protein [Gemmatimonadales bacterium]